MAMRTNLGHCGTRPERQSLKNTTCRCIGGVDEAPKSHRRRGGEAPHDMRSSTTIAPLVVLIHDKESCQIWACRWSSEGFTMQPNMILCFHQSVWVHRVDADGHALKSSLTLQEIAAENLNFEGYLFSMEKVLDKEVGCGSTHSHGVLGRELDRSEWKHVDALQSSNVLALSGSPSPLLSLTIRILNCDEKHSAPSALQLASWKRRLCGTIVIHSQAKNFTTTVELPGLDQKVVQLQVTALGSRSSSPQILFVVLPSTRITIQHMPPATNGVPGLAEGIPTLPAGTPQFTQLLLQTIFCIHQKVPVPRTFLMSGPAGVGKTYSVKRVMELCPLPLHLVSLRGSEVLQNRANGSEGLEGEFQTAAKLKEKAVIVFLDECDALVSVESAAATLSTLLDKVSTEWTNLLFVGATNRIDSIPGYLRRAGRLDKEILLSPPNAKERATILTSLLEQQVADGQNTVPSDDFTSIVNHVAELCVGYVPADLNALIRKATLLAKEQGPHASVVNFVEGAMSEVAPSALRDALLAAPPKITWEDIAGDPGGAKTALRQAIEWPRTKSVLFSRLGLIPPRGILLHGPPGCAKTTLARAAAGASGVAFLSLSPAQVYSSSYVGEAEAVVRRAFSLARSAAPCVVFFDEIDSIFGGAQDGGRGGSSEARVLSTFLNEMDGVDNKSGTDGVLVLGATNRPWTLDSALVRPGRLGDKVIYVPPPDPTARRAILEMQFPRQIQQMDLDWLSDDAVTGLMTGAELVGACQEAKLVILRSIIQKADNQSMDEFRIREELVTVLRSRKPLLSNPDVFDEYRMFDRRTAGT